MPTDYGPLMPADDDDRAAIPEDDPFYGCEDFPYMIRLRRRGDGAPRHAIVISNFREVHFVWMCQDKEFAVLDVRVHADTEGCAEVGAGASEEKWEKSVFPKHCVVCGRLIPSTWNYCAECYPDELMDKEEID